MGSQNCSFSALTLTPARFPLDRSYLEALLDCNIESFPRTGSLLLDNNNVSSFVSVSGHSCNRHSCDRSSSIRSPAMGQLVVFLSCSTLSDTNRHRIAGPLFESRVSSGPIVAPGTAQADVTLSSDRPRVLWNLLLLVIYIQLP